MAGSRQVTSGPHIARLQLSAPSTPGSTQHPHRQQLILVVMVHHTCCRRLDGYSFIYPEQWAAVTSSGNDIFLRNPFNVEQNLFVDISSPSSSR